MRRGGFIGQRVKRKEDPRFLRGEGNYVDDIRLHGMAHAALLRSPHAHARIRAVNTREALRIPGVLSVITFHDIAHLAKPIPMRLEVHPSFVPYLQYPLAKEKVRYVGEPVAVVVADSRYVAEDALESIQTDYEPLPAVVDARSAVKTDAVRIHEETAGNLAGNGVVDLGDVEGAFRRAGLTFSEQFTIQRHTGMPMETRGLIAEYNRGTKVLTVWGPTKVPYFNRSVLASFLGLPEHGVHFIEPDVGGGFGVRGEFYPEDFLVPFLALRLGRPVKWIEDRREHFLATNHSREQRWEVEVAAGKEGDLQAVKARIWNDMGAYIRTHSATVPALSATIFPGPYRLPNYWCEWNAVITNKTPIGTYRAPGRYECNFVRERLMDLISSRLGLDPAAVRFRNFIQPQEMPYSVGTSVLETPIIYDSGDYPRLMRKAVELSGYDRFKEVRRSWRGRTISGNRFRLFCGKNRPGSLRSGQSSDGPFRQGGGVHGRDLGWTRAGDHAGANLRRRTGFGYRRRHRGSRRHLPGPTQHRNFCEPGDSDGRKRGAAGRQEAPEESGPAGGEVFLLFGRGGPVRGLDSFCQKREAGSSLLG